MYKFKHAIIPTVVLVLGLGLTACTTETPAKVKSDSTPSTSVDSDGDGDVVVEEAESTDEPEQPEVASLGDTMIVGDWEIKVVEVAKNANDVVHQSNMFNDKPKGQYVLVTYKATYTGDERTADIFSDLTWTMTTSDQQTHDQASEVTPADNEEWPTTARKGGTVKGQAVFDVQGNLIKGGLLSVEGYDDDYDTVYADFGL